MKKLLAILAVFRKGEQVANPAAWKNGQITANMLGALVVAIGALARAFDLPVEISDDQAMAIGGGVLAAANVLLTVATSRKVGLPARPTGAAGNPGLRDTADGP